MSPKKKCSSALLRINGKVVKHAWVNTEDDAGDSSDDYSDESVDQQECVTIDEINEFGEKVLQVVDEWNVRKIKLAKVLDENFECLREMAKEIEDKEEEFTEITGLDFNDLYIAALDQEYEEFKAMILAQMAAAERLEDEEMTEADKSEEEEEKSDVEGEKSEEDAKSDVEEEKSEEDAKSDVEEGKSEEDAKSDVEGEKSQEEVKTDVEGEKSEKEAKLDVEGEKSEEEAKSDVEEEKSEEEAKSDVEEEKSEEEAKSDVEGAFSKVEEARSDAEDLKSDVDDKKSKSEETKSKKKKEKTKVENTKPKVEKETPKVENTNRKVKGKKPKVENKKPKVEDTKPKPENTDIEMENAEPAAKEARSKIVLRRFKAEAPKPKTNLIKKPITKPKLTKRKRKSNTKDPSPSILVSIGPNKTKVPECVLNSIDWSQPTAATRKLLMAIFDRETLAFHTLTGKPSPAFIECNRPTKSQLNPKKVADIIHIVTDRSKVPEKEVRGAITTKCADENKMFKQREKRKKLSLDENKENFPPKTNSRRSNKNNKKML